MTSTWETELFECHKAKDIGFLCCINNCCCGGLCVWTDALVKAGVPNAKQYGTSVLFGSLISNAGSLADSSALQGLGQAQSTVSFVNGRIALMKHYNIEEPYFATCFSRCCCPCCAGVQEVNTVMVREGLLYDFCSLKPDPDFKKASKSGGNLKALTTGRHPVTKPSSIQMDRA